MNYMGFTGDKDEIFENKCFCRPIRPNKYEDIRKGIMEAFTLEKNAFFLDGLVEQLNELNVPCSIMDKDLMVQEIKRRFKDILGKSCPKAVVNWIRGVTPGTTNRQNNYDLCMALEMDYNQTYDFFREHFLTMPFNVRSRVDAIYMYCICNRKPYKDVTRLLEESETVILQQQVHTSTSEICDRIFKIADDKQFIGYLNEHCYSSSQMYQLARNLIKHEVKLVKEEITCDVIMESRRMVSEDRLNSQVLEKIIGYNYQSQRHSFGLGKKYLPRMFTESLPVDVSFGKIVNDDAASYDTVRKTFMLLKFHNFYYATDNEKDDNRINENMHDFYYELDDNLISCGFAGLNLSHPFDFLLFYCANSNDPIEALKNVMTFEGNPDLYCDYL